MKVGDAFVLCDAGGGTVDLISYEITNLDPLEFRELVKGTGSTAYEQIPSILIDNEIEVALRALS